MRKGIINHSVNPKRLALFLAIAPTFMGLTSGMINALLMCLAFAILMINHHLLLPQKTLTWAFCFTTYCMMSSIWATETKTLFLTTFSYIQVVILIIVIWSGCDDREDLLFCLKSMAFGGIVYVVHILATNNMHSLLYGGRLGVKNDVAICLTMVSIIMLANKNSFKNKVLFYLILISFIFISMLQGSRKGIIIILLGILMIMMIESIQSQNVLVFLKKMLLFCGITVALYFLIMNTPLYNSIGVRVENTLTFFGSDAAVDNSTRDRDLLIQDGIRIWKNNPILGCGQDNFRYLNNVVYGYYSHNNYIEILSNLGIIGICVYYSYLALILKKAIFSFRRKQEFLSGVVLIIIVITLIIDYMMVSYSSESSYVFLGYAVASLKIFDLEQCQTNSNKGGSSLYV